MMQEKFRNIFIGLIAASMFLTGCRHRETLTENYPDGARKSAQAFLVSDDSAKVRHGIQMTWYPDGTPATMDLYRFGYREGNSFQWYPGGALKAKEHFTRGVRDLDSRFWGKTGELVGCVNPDGGDCAHPKPGMVAPHFCSRSD